MERYALDNGLTVVAEALPSFRSITMGLWIRAGSVNESARNNGVSHLLEHLFFKGTATRSARQIMELVESVGGTANAFTDREYTCLYAKVLDAHLPLAIDLVSDILLHSTYADFEREKAVIEEEIQAYYEQPDEHVHDVFMQALWRDHPLGLTITGTRDAVQALRPRDVRAYYDAWYGPANVVIAVAGNFDSADLRARLNAAFGSWDARPRTRCYEPPVLTAASVNDRRDIKQAHLCVGTQGVTARDPRRYAFNVLVNVLGGSSISRLFQRVREEEGLAYHVQAFLGVMERAGMMGVYSAQGAENTDRVVDIVIQELCDLRDRPLPEEELRQAKEQLKGNITLGLESTSNRMMRLARSTLALDRVDDIDTLLEQIDAVTAADVQALAAEFFRPDHLVYTVLGPLDPVAPRSF